MRALDVLRFSASALRLQRRRTALSLLGVAIGIGAMLVMTAIGEGARTFAVRQFDTLGAHLIAVVPGRVETSGAIPGIGGAPNDLTLDDARALERAVQRTNHVVPLALGNDRLSHGTRARDVIVLGTTRGMQSIRGLRMRSGEFLPQAPWERGSAVVVLGAKLAHELFPGQNPLGASVRLGESRLRVIGTLQPRGTHLGADLDEAAFIPVTTAMRMFDQSSLFRVLVELEPGSDLARAKREVTTVLFDRHDEEDFTLITQDAVVEAVSRIVDALTYALAGIAAVSLVVAGIGIMNVMLVSVTERTREIGLDKALGAEPRHIMALFLVESALLSGAGGVCGLVLSETIVRVLSWWQPNFEARTPTWALASALVLSFVVGVVFGTLPARRAMRLQPVAALARR